MADTFNENLARDPLDCFTDREEILAQFQHLLQSAQTGTFHLLAVKGQSGTGKTFLIEYLSKRICPQAGWQTGVLAFAQSFPDFRALLDGVEDGLKKCVPRQRLTEYRILREQYKRSFDECRANVTVNQTVEARDASSLSNIQMNAQVNAELRRREMQLRAELTRALLELAEGCEHPLCLFIDGYERLGEMDPELVGWLWEEVLLRLSKKASKPILLVTCGWEYPMSPVIQPFSTNKELDDFDLLRVKSYLQTQVIISSDISQQELLVQAFCDLTKGHPFVLALAVMYFQTLPELERTPESLRTKSPLLFEEARVQWLEERLLKRLPEPYRTLLEHGPILRFFDQATLNALLSAELDGKQGEMTLDDRSYERFLRYPFINQKNVLRNALQERPTFHDLMRSVGLETLRRLHPETKHQLHHVMAKYYMALIQVAQQYDASQQSQSSNQIYAEWFAAIPEQEFYVWLEWLYHALQVKEMQFGAFYVWESLISRAINRWQREQARPLLELVQQLVKEKEPFLEMQSNRYGQYLVWYSQFLGQEAHWDDAFLVLQEALLVFEREENLLDQATALNAMGFIDSSQRRLEQALDYYKRALTLAEQIDNPANIATFLNNVGLIYQQQERLEQALDYCERSLVIRERLGNLAKTAHSLNSIGGIYDLQGQLEQALGYYERALTLAEQVGNPADSAIFLNNIGFIYQQQGQSEQALGYYERALTLAKQVGNPAEVVHCLDNIVAIYQRQGPLERELYYSEQALTLKEKMGGNLIGIATALNNIGLIYQQQEQLEQALDYYKRALALAEQVDNPANITRTLDNIVDLYLDQEQWYNAIPFCLKAVSLYEQIGRGFEADAADKLEEIAVCYAMQGEFEKGESYYKRAEQIRAQLRKIQE